MQSIFKLFFLEPVINVLISQLSEHLKATVCEIVFWGQELWIQKHCFEFSLLMALLKNVYFVSGENIYQVGMHDSQYIGFKYLFVWVGLSVNLLYGVIRTDTFQEKFSVSNVSLIRVYM